MDDDLPGITILPSDDFQFDCKVEIGRGGCAKTYRVNCLDQKRALKKPNGKTKLCAKEIAILNNIQHKNIVRLFGIVHYEGAKCIVMELAEHGSLYDILYGKDRRPFHLTEDHKRQWINEIACGLKYLHHGLAKPVVHGDIKSPNLLIFNYSDNQKTAKLADFGLSEELEVTAEGGDDRYSCRWAAPETVKATLKSTKSDVWSYGAAVWEIWKESLPFSFLGDHSREVESRIILGVGTGSLIPYAPERDGFPDIYHELLMNCFIMEHKKRWTFQKICDYLQNYNQNSNHQHCMRNCPGVVTSTAEEASNDDGLGERGSDVVTPTAETISNESEPLDRCSGVVSSTAENVSNDKDRYVKAVTLFERVLERNSKLFTSVKNLFRSDIPKGELERITSPTDLIDKLERLTLLSYEDSALLQKRLGFLGKEGVRLARYFSDDKAAGDASDCADSKDASPVNVNGGIDLCIRAKDGVPLDKASSFSAVRPRLAQEEFGQLRVEAPDNCTRLSRAPRISGPPRSLGRTASDYSIRCINEVIAPIGVERAFPLVADEVLEENFTLFARRLLSGNHHDCLRELTSRHSPDRTMELLDYWLGQERSRGREPSVKDLATALRQSRMSRVASRVERMSSSPQ